MEKAAKTYGYTLEEMEQHLAEHNPIDRLAPLAKAGIPLLHIHGDVDKLIPLETNAQVIHDRYQKLGGKMEIIVVPGKGHEAVDEFFQNKQFLEFLARGGFEK
jgi:pimeloyl-ACP methyl ester carboxylesterase